MIKKKIIIEIECDTNDEFENTLDLISGQLKFGFTEGFNNSPPNSYNYDVDVIEDHDESEIEMEIFHE